MLLLLLLQSCAAFSSRPIVWTIAGSDSGGGAGIEADLRTMASLGTHGCSVVTALTAQNSVGVASVLGTDPSHVAKTIDTLANDMSPDAVKIGMVYDARIAAVVADFVEQCKAFVVIDPIFVSSSGRQLLDEEGMEVLTSRLLPACSLATPNAREAAALLGRPVDTIEGATTAAVELCQRYNCSVLVKGGHLEGKGAADVLATRAATTLLEGRRDFSAGDNNVDGGVHGTGCVLSSAVAARMAFGRETLLDAVVGAKALCAEAISNSVAVGKGARAALPPPLWPSPLSSSFVPSIGKEMARAFPRTTTEMKLYALADSSERVQALFDAGVKDVQLRVKTSREDLQNAAVPSAKAAREAGARLWINDDWRVASEVGAYGVHLGQEDIAEDVDDLEELAESGLRLGVSTHCLSELAVATAIRPSYVALGPIFGTTSKEIAFDARGTDMVRNFRNLVPSDTPLVAIGGVDLSNAESVLAAGADSIAVISALPDHRDVDAFRAAVRKWDCDLSWRQPVPESENAR